MPPSERPKTDRKRKAAAPAVGSDSVNDSPRVSESDIALKAFAYYCGARLPDGSALEDWLAPSASSSVRRRPAPRRRRQPSA